jgi:hypothetical protein
VKRPVFFACDDRLRRRRGCSSHPGEEASAQLQHQPPRYPHFRLFGTSQGRCSRRGRGTQKTCIRASSCWRRSPVGSVQSCARHQQPQRPRLNRIYQRNALAHEFAVGRLCDTGHGARIWYRRAGPSRIGVRRYERGIPNALGDYLFSRRHSSIARRIASPRLHFFFSIHRSIRPSFPSFEVVMKTLLNSCSIRGSTLSAFRRRNHQASAAAPATSAIIVHRSSCAPFSPPVLGGHSQATPDRPAVFIARSGRGSKRRTGP